MDDIQNIPDLDRVIHEKGRLAILSLLKVNAELSFSEIKKQLSLTDGNLSVHIKHLQTANYIKVHKSFVNNRPLTTCSMTKTGSFAFDAYLVTLEKLIQHLKEA